MCGRPAGSKDDSRTRNGASQKPVMTGIRGKEFNMIAHRHVTAGIRRKQSTTSPHRLAPD